MTIDEKIGLIFVIVFIGAAVWFSQAMEKTEDICRSELKAIKENTKEPIRMDIHYTQEKPTDGR